MKFETPVPLEKITDQINAVFIQPENHMVLGKSELNVEENSDLIFVDHPKYFEKALHSKASTIIINARIELLEWKTIISSDRPFEDYNQLCKTYFPKKTRNTNINQNIHPTPRIGNKVSLGSNVKISSDSQILPSTVISNNDQIGSTVIIGPNTVISHDSFYYNSSSSKHSLMHTKGGVIIYDLEEIGANSTLDTVVSSETVTRSGVKIDKLVQIEFGTTIGKYCIIAASSAISGCITIQNHVTIWGQVEGVIKVTIQDDVVVLGQSGVSKNIEE